MDLIILIALFSGLLGIALINKRQKNQEILNQEGFKHYNSREDYLEKVKNATKSRFEEEKKAQEYKINVKKNYLE